MESAKSVMHAANNAMDRIIKIALFAMMAFTIIILPNCANIAITAARFVQIMFAKHVLWDLILVVD